MTVTTPFECPPGKTRMKLAPYYQDDLVTLYHGDCLEHLDCLDQADVMVTDPPYGYSHRSSGGPRGSATWKNLEIQGDTDTTSRDQVLAAWEGKPALLFGSWKRPHPKGTLTQLIWDKGGHAGGLGDLSIPWKNNHEEIYVLGSGFKGHRGSGVLSGHHVTASERSGRNHPHEKPVSLMEELIGKCPPGVVVDPFAGSGSTLRAAKNLGRRAIGFEIEERYCEIAARRLAQEVLFA